MKQTKAEALKPLAYSYVRFSTKKQEHGSSQDRQDDAASEWCGRNGYRLDKSTTFRDLGRQALRGDHRKNPERNALARFLAGIQGADRTIPVGSLLILENL